MSYILRTWKCLNKRCGKEFISGSPNPACDSCRCVRVSYIPGGGHLRSAATSHNDKTLRAVADRFGLTNLGQRGGTHAGERAEPTRPTAPTVGAYEPMPGFKTPWGPGVTGSWSDKPFPIKGKLPVNSAKFKNQRGRIPTTVTHVDPRKVPL